MLLTPARRHAIACAARKSGGAAADALGQGSSEYRLTLVQLGVDLRRLKAIQSVERKVEAKRGMIHAYDAWVDAALAADTPAQDEVVTTMMVWAIDIADWPRALRLAAHVLRHGLTLPERYRRTTGTLIAEEIATAGLSAIPLADLPTLQQADDLVSDEDMPDQVRAKLKKAIGLAFKARVDTFDPEADCAVAGGRPALIAAALDHLTRAQQLDPLCGVKKLIEQLRREAKKAPAP